MENFKDEKTFDSWNSKICRERFKGVQQKKQNKTQTLGVNYFFQWQILELYSFFMYFRMKNFHPLILFLYFGTIQEIMEAFNRQGKYQIH